jgi:hypothetical protein
VTHKLFTALKPLNNLAVDAMNGYESIGGTKFKLTKQRFFRLPSSGIGLP